MKSLNLARRLEKSFQKKSLNKSFLLVSLSLMPFLSNAVHISTYRIYMDSEQRNTSFMVFNRDAQPQECDLKLRYYNYDASGKMTPYEGEEPPKHSAHSWMRYSPKKFTLTPANSQTIRFSMRRKANVEAAEYRAYLVVDCGVQKKVGEKDSQELINIRPRLVHNVPIIVRTKPMDIELKFTNMRMEGNKLHFNIDRSGKRSTYGNLEVIDKATDKKIAGTTNISIYNETTSQEFSYSIGEHKPEQVKLRFTEDPLFGGTKTIEQNVSF